METKIFDFDVLNLLLPTLPKELRGKKRDESRLVVLNRVSQQIDHKKFNDIFDYLQKGDVLVLNDSYVLFNSLIGYLNGEEVEVRFYGFQEHDCLVQINSKLEYKMHDLIKFKQDPNLSLRLLRPDIQNTLIAEISSMDLLVKLLSRSGGRFDDLDSNGFSKNPAAYKSVFATKPGSLEPPSAGLHFTVEILHKLAQKGIQIVPITLHVAATEMLAVRYIEAKNVEEHKVKPEYYEINEKAANVINKARSRKNKIFAVGTTVVRALESATSEINNKIITKNEQSWSDLYIYPGYKYKAIDMFLTNLHQPRSSHIVLTAAFAGVDLVLKAYQEIIKYKYEFDMFGDCMLII